MSRRVTVLGTLRTLRMVLRQVRFWGSLRRGLYE